MTDLASFPPRRRVWLILLLVAFTTLASHPARSAAPPLVEVGRTTLSPRLQELTLRTAALPTDTKVRVLLPVGYASGTRRYPVLYLLNGGGGSYLDWTTQGNAEKLTASAAAIIVMPDGGGGGNYTDWYGPDGNFTPRWETYHITQLLPWVDAHFRTIADRSERAIAGLSMGGNGALHYAARHPDLFAAVASWSGANDVFNPIIYPITETTEISNGALPGSVFGPRATQQIRWRAFNPVDLAGNLGGEWISLRFGNGKPGGPDGSKGVDIIETAVHDANVSVHEQLLAAGIPHRYDDYGPGAHNWYYWSRDLAQDLPGILHVFAQHRAAPTTITYWSTAPAYDVFGWHVRVTRTAAEGSRLVKASRAGFTFTGSGTAVVRTPGLFRVGQSLRVSVKDQAGTRTAVVVVGHDRAVSLSLDLGAPNPHQQDTALALATGTAIRTATVTLS